MFHAAVESHKKTIPPPNKLAKSLFPSSSPDQKPSAHNQPSFSAHIMKSRGNAPSRPSGIFSSNQSTVNTHNNAAARSYQQPGRLGALVSRNSFENASSTASMLTAQNGGRPSFHSDIVIDEDEFDSDIDLDAEHASLAASQKQSSSLPPFKAPTRVSPNSTSSYQASPANTFTPPTQPHTANISQSKEPLYPSLKPPHQSLSKQETLRISPRKTSDENISYPVLPVPAQSSVEIFPTHSQWPSSPAEHFKPPPLAQQLRRSATEANLSTHETPDEGDSMRPPRAKRSRKLPWNQSEAEAESEEAVEAPWNQTASDIKGHQKRERHKFLVKNRTMSPEKRAEHNNALKELFSFSEEQESIMSLALGEGKRPGKSIFFTGSAGTGKSVLLRELIRRMKAKYAGTSGAVAVTASTGLAACNVGGITLHSYSGGGLCQDPAHKIVTKIKRNQKSKQRWFNTKVLFIDEVSMVDAEFFDKLEEIARTIRKNPRPFGGIQLIVTGDFFQLPPVPDKNKQSSVKFSFEANTWRTCIHETILLNKVFRQKDPEFAGYLNAMRLGNISPECVSMFKSLSRNLDDKDGLEATELFPLRDLVSRANFTRLAQLRGQEFVYSAADSGKAPELSREKMLQQFIAPKEIKLKVGAQVMLIKNMDETLVNGSMGRVMRFMSENDFTAYQEETDYFIATQPDASENDKASIRDKRLSKVPDDNNRSKDASRQLWPLVRFPLNNGTSRDMLIFREMWQQETPEGEVLAAREQVPLILAWALSIHKAQGQTLKKVKVNLDKSFEDGMSYVALSRATTKAGLQVIGFDAKKVTANPKVKVFYEGLQNIEKIKAASVASGAATASKQNKRNNKGSVADLSSEPEDYPDEWELGFAQG